MKKMISLFMIMVTSIGCARASAPWKWNTITPASAITDYLSSNVASQNVVLLGTRTLSANTSAGIYTYVEPGESGWAINYSIGIAIAKQTNPLQWEVVSSFTTKSPRPENSSLPIEYAIQQNTQTVVFGEIRSKEVGSVEILYANGQVTSEQVKTRFFLVISARALDVCRVWANDREGQEIYHFDISPELEEGNECPENPQRQ